MSMRMWTYASVFASTETFLDDLSAFLSEQKLSQRERHHIMMAASEAFTNAVVHGNQCDPAKTVTVYVDINQGLLSADIVDQGHRGLDSVQARSAPDRLSESGRGIDLMRHYADHLEFSTAESGGLMVSIHFDLSNDRETTTR
jgi:serine/threonine-protein kinase RsbW